MLVAIGEEDSIYINSYHLVFDKSFLIGMALLCLTLMVLLTI